MPTTRSSHGRLPKTPSLDWERRAWGTGVSVVAGVDEAGRGAWAGPLVAAAVALPPDPRARARITRQLNRAGGLVNDSKLLTPLQRERTVEVIEALGLPTSVVEIEPGTIDELGLGVANRLALCRAVEGLAPAPEHVLVDAFRLSELTCPHEPIVHGDRHSLSIALASIVAKLHRDRLMARLSEEFPQYEFERHKGYGTEAHARAIVRHGISPVHRRSFAPIATLCADEQIDD